MCYSKEDKRKLYGAAVEARNKVFLIGPSFVLDAFVRFCDTDENMTTLSRRVTAIELNFRFVFSEVRQCYHVESSEVPVVAVLSV